MSKESGKAFKELATAIKKMTSPSPAAGTHAQNSKSAAAELKNILENYSSLPTKADLQELMPVLVIASVLIDIINCVDKISLSVHELSRNAWFKNSKSTEKQLQVLHRGIVKPVNDVGNGHDDHVVVEVHDSPEKKESSAP